MHVACTDGEREKCVWVLIIKRKGKRLLGIAGNGWEDNDKVDVNEIVCEGMDWIDLAQDRDSWWVFLNTVMNL